MINQIKFVGIDDFNRPIFKSVHGRSYYGSTDILFTYGTKVSEVLEKLSESDLVYFGSRFNCEPMGTTPTNQLEIIQ